jgi:hypothetical protein
MEAARSFETATLKDPNCAMAWWGLSRAQERWGQGGDQNKSLLKANELKERVSYREQQLILARMQEKGLQPGVGDASARRNAAIATLDALLAIHEDDEEAWFYRGQIAAEGQLFGGGAASVPFYKALLRINPLHPGANHELVHFYENFQRPALGWVYSENYIKSSPGIPHPWHMQSHLATRLGRWDKSSGSSSRAIEIHRAYQKDTGVKPTEDAQFIHHTEILMLSLTHDGRYREARALKKECWDYGFRHWLPWFRLAMGERDYDEALKISEEFRRNDKLTASYLAALVYLAQDDPVRAKPHVDVLDEGLRTRKNDKQLKYRLSETRGMLLCLTGGGDAGLKLLEKVVKETKDDYRHHAWGNGAYYMEVWGQMALRCAKLDVAEEAFLEALAHDHGSAKAAMGLQLVCEQQGRPEEARQYAALARKFWKHAEVRTFDTELASLRAALPQVTAAGKPAGAGNGNAQEGGR